MEAVVVEFDSSRPKILASVEAKKNPRCKFENSISAKNLRNIIIIIFSVSKTFALASAMQKSLSRLLLGQRVSLNAHEMNSIEH